MDESEFQETVARLREVNEVIETLDPGIRSAAFEILSPYVDGAPASSRLSSGRSSAPKRKAKSAAKKATSKKRSSAKRAASSKTPAVPLDIDTTSMESFVRTAAPTNKPADVVYALAAWWFGEYGSAPLTPAQMKVLADEIGVTISNRPDMTLSSAQKDSKQLFRGSARAGFVPTVPHGELYLKETYSVKKGTKTPPAADST